MSVPAGRPGIGGLVAEQFCDEVYDYVDDMLAEAMDDMERELCEAALKAGAGGAVDQSSSSSSSVEESVKKCCDNVQKRLQKEFDRNLDIFDRYVKKNMPTATSAVRRDSSLGAVAAAAVAGPGNGGINISGSPRARTEEAATNPAAGVGEGGWNPLASSAAGEGARDSGIFEVEEGAPPVRLEEEEALDAEIQRLRKRRREGLRRCAAMVRKGAREAAVLQDVNDYVEALQMGVSSSFDDNGLTPVPAKVQEAVQSSAELRVTADRAQELTRRLERQVQESTTAGAGRGAGSGSGSGAVEGGGTSGTRDLQATFVRSNEQQVVTGGATQYLLHGRG